MLSLEKPQKNTKEKYPLDFDNVDDFTDELIHFSNYLCECSEFDDLSSPMCFLNHLRCTNGGSLLASFPNVDIEYRIYLTLPVANTEGERSFSVLKRVKNYLRSTLSQEKLCDLSLLAIESDLTGVIDFEEIIDEFSKRKSRKKPL